MENNKIEPGLLGIFRLFAGLGIIFLYSNFLILRVPREPLGQKSSLSMLAKHPFLSEGVSIYVMLFWKYLLLFSSICRSPAHGNAHEEPTPLAGQLLPQTDHCAIGKTVDDRNNNKCQKSGYQQTTDHSNG